MSEVPDHDRWLSEPEAERLRAMPYRKRHDESRLGRWTAKQAVAQTLRLDPDPAVLSRLVIRNAGDGAPEVFMADEPAPMSVSMTDRADWAVCTVIGGDRPIGCDLELVEPRSDAFVADYFTAAEQALVEATPEHRDLLVNLIWSAKESALKVLRTGLRRDTRSVEVSVGTDRLDGWCALYVTSTEGLTFTGWWHRFGPFLLTYVSASNTVQPISLTHPSPLEGAVPGHGWMNEPLR